MMRPMFPFVLSSVVALSGSAPVSVAVTNLVVTPSAPHVSESSFVHVRINVAGANAVPWHIGVGGRHVASGTEHPRTADGFVVVSVPWTPTVAGDVVVSAVVDPENTLREPETARTDNTMTRRVTVLPEADPVRAPEPPPSAAPREPEHDARGRPGSRGSCTAWERRAASRGEGFIAMRLARAVESGFDYVECAQRLGADVARLHCTPDDRARLTKKAWYLQPGDLEPVRQSVDCR